MSRRVFGLKRAELLAKSPHGEAHAKRGAKAAGLRYERALARAMPFALRGQWFAFEDFAGVGCCQSDFIVRFLGQVFVIESKLSDAEGARGQLRELYEPVLAAALGENVRGLAILRHLSKLSELSCKYNVYARLQDAILGTLERPSRLAILHWRERTPLGLGGLSPQAPLLARKGLASRPQPRQSKIDFFEKA